MERASETRANPSSPPRSRLAVLVAVAALALALMAILSSFGARWGWWHFSFGFEMLRVAAYGGMITATISLVAIYLTRPGSTRSGLPFAILGLIVGLATFVVLWQVQRLGRSVPPIHDITTDMNNPPEFVEIAPLRADAPNPIEYGGPEVAAQQRNAYPDLGPLVLDVRPERVFRHAFDAARAMGWEIVAADSTAGRIEATAETFWYGFKDDIVVRVRMENGGTVLDARSKSRVGGGDLGVNARRIRRYLRQVEKRL